jgi:hypothetical protein
VIQGLDTTSRYAWIGAFESEFTGLSRDHGVGLSLMAIIPNLGST